MHSFDHDFRWCCLDMGRRVSETHFRKCYFGTTITADTELCTSHTITHWSLAKEKVSLQTMASAWASWSYSSIQKTLTILQQDVPLLSPAVVVQESSVSLDQLHFLILNGCLLSKPPAFCQGQVLVGFIYLPITEEMKDMLQADLQPKQSRSHSNGEILSDTAKFYTHVHRMRRHTDMHKKHYQHR